MEKTTQELMNEATHLLNKIIYEVQNAPAERTLEDRYTQVLWLNRASAELVGLALQESSRLHVDTLVNKEK